MPDQEDSPPVSGDLVHGDKPVLSGTFTGTVNVGSTIIQQVAPAAGPAAPRPSIFLSYAHRDDRDFVIRLHADLLARGFDVWRDETDLGSDGPDLSDAVRDEIDRCARFVPVIGPAAFERPVVQAEWNHARLLCKPFTPVWRLGERPQPDGFEDKLYVDFRDDAGYAAKLDELARLLGRTPDSPGPFLTRVPELPPGVIPRRELEQLRRLRQPLTAGATMVAITGRAATHALQAPGGLGKSVLAALFARECPTRWAFGDGVVWLEVGKSPSIPAVMRGLKRHEDALRYYDRTIALYPYAMYYRNRADTLIELERYAEATQALDTAESLQPGQPYALYHRSRIALCTHRPADAARLIEQAVEMRPLLNGFHYQLAYALLAGGNVDRALAEFERALELTHARRELVETEGELAGPRAPGRTAAAGAGWGAGH